MKQKLAFQFCVVCGKPNARTPYKAGKSPDQWAHRACLKEAEKKAQEAIERAEAAGEVHAFTARIA